MGVEGGGWGVKNNLLLHCEQGNVKAMCVQNTPQRLLSR